MTWERAPRTGAPLPMPPLLCRLAAALRRLRVPGGVLGVVGAALGLVGVVDPREPGHYPACPLLRHTGLWCPGCGGLRSAHALVHGDLPAALDANALAVVGCGVFAALWVVWAVRSVRGRPVVVAPGPVLPWTAGAFLVAFTIVRNLPFGGWLHP